MSAQERQPDTQLTGEKHRRLEDQLDDIISSEDLTQEPAKKKTKKTRSDTGRLAKLWVFTMNNYTDQDIQGLISSPWISHYVFQEEDEGTPHLQGVLRLKRKNRLGWLKRHVSGKAHWEACDNLGGSIIYCSKKAKRKSDGRLWQKGWHLSQEDNSKVKDPLAGKDLYSYQEEIIDIIVSEPDERKVYWFWSSKGNIGKSSLVKHLCLKYGAVCIGGKFSDAQYAIAERAAAGKTLKILIFDIPRSQGNKISYTAVENIKNGCFFSNKYKSDMVLINIPHIIMFANEGPNEFMLSPDRWVIKNLDNESDC